MTDEDENLNDDTAEPAKSCTCNCRYLWNYDRDDYLHAIGPTAVSKTPLTSIG